MVIGFTRGIVPIMATDTIAGDGAVIDLDRVPDIGIVAIVTGIRRCDMASGLAVATTTRCRRCTMVKIDLFPVACVGMTSITGCGRLDMLIGQLMATRTSQRGIAVVKSVLRPVAACGAMTGVTILPFGRYAMVGGYVVTGSAGPRDVAVIKRGRSPTSGAVTGVTGFRSCWVAIRLVVTTFTRRGDTTVIKTDLQPIVCVVASVAGPSGWWVVPRLTVTTFTRGGHIAMVKLGIPTIGIMAVFTLVG